MRAVTGRQRALRILAGVMAVGAVGFGLFTAIFGIVNPAQEPHAFHNLIVAALLIIVSAPPVVAIARNPSDPVPSLIVLAGIGVAALGTMALALTIDPFTLPFAVLVGVLWALAAPSVGARDLAIERPSLLLIGLSIVAAVAFAPYVLEQAGLQRTDHTSEHAAFFHWVEMSFYAAAIPLAGLVAGLWAASRRLAAPLAGLASIVLGVGSLVLAGFASAMPQVVAWIAVAVGVAFLIVAAIGRRGRDEAQ